MLTTTGHRSRIPKIQKLTNEHDGCAPPFNCTHYCLMVQTVWTMKYGTPHHRYFRKSETQSKILSSQSMRSPSLRRVGECVVEGVCLCVSLMDIPFFRRGFVTCGWRKPTDTHTLTSWCFLCTWTKAFTEIHACGRDFPIPLFPTTPFQMKIHYCVIVKFPVCRRRHMSESDEDRQPDLRFSSGALKMRALLVLHFLLNYMLYCLSVGESV